MQISLFNKITVLFRFPFRRQRQSDIVIFETERNRLTQYLLNLKAYLNLQTTFGHPSRLLE